MHNGLQYMQSFVKLNITGKLKLTIDIQELMMKSKKLKHTLREILKVTLNIMKKFETCARYFEFMMKSKNIFRKNFKKFIQS